MFLLARFRGTNLRGVPHLALDSQFFQQIQKPLHRSDRFHAHEHRAGKLRIKLPHLMAFVHQRSIHDFSGCGVEHRQRLLASMQITSYNSHSASFDPSAVRVNNEAVYSARREADLVMASTVQVPASTDRPASLLSVVVRRRQLYLQSVGIMEVKLIPVLNGGIYCPARHTYTQAGVYERGL